MFVGMKKRWCVLAALAVMVMVCVRGASYAMPAQASAGAAQAAQPAKVSVGMYLSDVPSVDLREGLFAFDGYLWLRWDPAQFQATGQSDPGSPLPRCPADTYEVMGVHELSTENVSSRPGYAAFRVQGKVRQAFELERFPLDEHVLTLRIQDSESEAHKVQLIPDGDGTVAREMMVHGWTPGTLTVEATTDEFSTNFGDPQIPTGNKSVYSCITFQLPLRHDGWPYFFKLMAALFIATLLAMLAFLIRPINVDPRFGLPIGALFAAVANNWVVSAALPDRSGLTLADWLHIVAYVAIFMTILLSIRSLKLFESGDEDGARRFDRRCLAWMPLAYVASSIILVVLYRG